MKCFFILRGMGNSLYVAKQLDSEQVSIPQAIQSAIGKKADYINTIKMADNFLPGFDMNEQIATELEKNPDDRYYNENIRLTEIVEANNQHGSV